MAVIGGGITGLAAAHHMRELAAARELPVETTVYEAGARLGGALETIHRDGFVIETGADSFLSEKPAARSLAERLGLGARLVNTQEEFRRTMVVRNGRLVPIPDGFSLLAPTYLRPLLTSPLFSLRGKLRILMEPLIPRRRDGADESLAAFVTRRLGRETLERVAQPLAGGIYTADPADLSVAATLPRFVAMEQRAGSIIRGLRQAAHTRAAQAAGTSGARWSLFLSFDWGIGCLTERLAARLGDCVRFGEVAALGLDHPSTDETGRWRIVVRGHTTVSADAIICAVPAHCAAPLIRPLAALLADQLTAIDYSSAATVNLAYRTADLPRPLASFGFVVPVIEGRGIIAGSFSSLKFAGRAPAGMLLARVFIGGALQRTMMDLDDQSMVKVARREFADLLGITTAPHLTQVRRWVRAMPQYGVGHPARVAAIERAAAPLPGFALAGSYLRGVGIPDCIASGERAAEAILAQLAGPA